MAPYNKGYIRDITQKLGSVIALDLMGSLIELKVCNALEIENDLND